MSDPRRLVGALVLAGCLVAGTLVAAPVPDDPIAVPSLDARRLRLGVDLASSVWQRNGEPTDAAVTEGPPEDARVVLPFDGMGVRWSTTFRTASGAAVRLGLDWVAAPDGLLFEIQLDGQVLRPVRDGWRPRPRPLRTDLGPFWLGPGEHLLELIAREEVADGVLRVATLEIRDP